MKAIVQYTSIFDYTPVTVTMTAKEALAYLRVVGPISTDSMIRLPYENMGKHVSPSDLDQAQQVLYDLYGALDDAIDEVQKGNRR